MILRDIEIIQPYLRQRRQSRNDGERHASEISKILEDKYHTSYIARFLRGERSPGVGIGSCTRFELFFDEKWHILPTHLIDNVRFVVCVAVSDRGPFVVGYGFERLESVDCESWQVGKLLPHASESATKEAEALCELVAAKLGLHHLDLEWLRQIELVGEDTSDDALASLDYSSPTALNVLFAEDL